jgi:hypothetical protein
VTFSKEADKMYYIGPLLFWAWAEMTAGFFILSAPYLSRFVKELPLPTKVKAALGFNTQSNPPIVGSEDLVTIGGSGAKRRKPPSNFDLVEGDEYGEIEDGQIRMTGINRNESQEGLRAMSDTSIDEAGRTEVI